MVYNQASERHIPSGLVSFFLPGVFTAGRLIYGYQEVDPLAVVSRVSCPILFIHEQYDDLVSARDETQTPRRRQQPR